MHRNNAEVWNEKELPIINGNLLLKFFVTNKANSHFQQQCEKTDPYKIKIDRTFDFGDQENGIYQVKELVMEEEEYRHTTFGRQVIFHGFAIYQHAGRVGMFYREQIEKIKQAYEYTLYPVNTHDSGEPFGMLLVIADAKNIYSNEYPKGGVVYSSFKQVDFCSKYKSGRFRAIRGGGYLVRVGHRNNLICMGLLLPPLGYLICCFPNRTQIVLTKTFWVVLSV